MGNDVHNISGAQFKQPDEGFQVASASSAIQYDFADVQPPPGRYIGVDDSLQIAVYTNTGNNATTINVRVLGLDGLIHPFQFAFTPGGTRLVNLQRFQLMEGWLLSATATWNAQPNSQFWQYVVLSLTRSPFGQGNQYDTLFAGYTYQNVPVGYPYAPMQRPTDGAGVLKALQFSAPAAGADWNITVPAGARWRIVSLNVLLTTAVAAGNRQVSFIADDGAIPYMKSISNFLHGPSITNTYNAWDSAALVNVPFDLGTQQPLPSNFFLPVGHRIRSNTTGIQAADTWGTQQLDVVEWLDNA